MLLTVRKHVTEKRMLSKRTSLLSRTRLSWILYGPAEVTCIMICNPLAVLAVVSGAFS